MREYTRMAMKKPTSSAYQVSSLVYLRLRQHKEAISEVERGLALDPNSPGCLDGMGWALTMAGRPKEGIEYYNKSIRLDPRNRYLYLRRLGVAHFCMGEFAEAATLIEQALRLNPEDGSIATALAGYYEALGRDQDARAMLELRRKKPGGGPPNVGDHMFLMPFRDRTVADRYAQGLLKAGLAPAKISGGYFPAYKENQLTGEEIKSLLSGSRTTGISTYRELGKDGKQWWRNYKKNGDFTWRGSSTFVGPSSDNGKSRIEGDMICHQFQKSYWGLEFCGTVFRNPRGTNEGKDEYFFCNDIGFEPFSLVR
jgi:tetratricopeptide (TPR) repeat protein